jgi:sigma-B regulation protein RsbU (phosphoserine phosphatase)
MMANSTYTLGYTCLTPGDTLFLYTDGVIDARDTDGGLFGTERMVDVAVQPGLPAEALLDGVDQAIRRHVGATEQADDITMLAVRRKEL